MRDLPRALARRGWQTTVIVPSYGCFHRLPGATETAKQPLRFGGTEYIASIWQLPSADHGLTQLVIDHDQLAPGALGEIYSTDPDDRPYATDASKFAFFSTAVAAYVNDSELPPTVVHLHDWHTAFYLLLRSCSPKHSRLRDITAVFTIHNLAFQGIRPLANDDSSLAAWFPELEFPYAIVSDPRYPDCVNPMAAAIRLADRVNTVSPTYAQEILEPSNPGHGFSGGEGLEEDLNTAARQQRLSGILNGCEYSGQAPRRLGWQRTLAAIDSTVMQPQFAHRLADREKILMQLKHMPKRRPRVVLTSVGRMTPQKVALFLQPTSGGISAIECILRDMQGQGVLLLLGSGDTELEQRLLTIAENHRNFLFLCGYSESLADTLYRVGDLFLMPSSFEPCGISQLLAMRAAQPCVVHGVGGLKDTVIESETGFVFGGNTPTEQADQFVSTVTRARQFKTSQRQAWQELRKRAAEARFTWDAAATAYEQWVYNTHEH